MIRIDFKRDDNGYIQTIWVKEDENSHSIMGRLLFTEEDFANFQGLVETPFGSAYKFEEKK